jgi:2,4-dienoyl-CoA reductase-like NADH-dependent reductase (Old Yellow Enzyme family)
MQEQHRELFKPIRISGCEIKNRFFMAPMGCFGLVDQDGILTDDGQQNERG